MWEQQEQQMYRPKLYQGAHAEQWPPTVFKVMIYGSADTILCSIQSTDGW